LTHKKIGNQIVLYTSSETVDNMQEAESSEESYIDTGENNTFSEIVEPTIETRYKLDTVFLKDTIYRVDTIRIIDTVFIKPEKPEKQEPAKIKELPVDFFQQESNREKGWAGAIYVAPVLSDFSMVENDVTFSLRSYALGIDAIKLLNRWNFSMGLRFSYYGQKLDQQYETTTGGNYQTDTIDIYYTIVDTDTSWYYVTDSTWIPLDSRQYNYDRSNAIGYLELNLSASYDFYYNSNIRLYGKIGAQVGGLVYKNGIAIPDENHLDGISFADLNFNASFALSVSAGMKLRLVDQMDFMMEPYYLKYFNQYIKEHSYDNKLNAFGLKFGLIYYF
jgi:hypothetical protein